MEVSEMAILPYFRCGIAIGQCTVGRTQACVSQELLLCYSLVHCNKKSVCVCVCVDLNRLTRCLYSGLVGGLPFVARVALLACVGGLAFVVCAFGGFLL